MTLCHAQGYILYIFGHVSAFSVLDLLLILTKDFVSLFSGFAMRNCQDRMLEMHKIQT